MDKQLLSEFTLISLTELLTEMYTLQGKCERIKNTPFPRQYAYFSKVFTYIFIILLPMGIVGKFGPQSSYAVWATIPFSVLVSWIFVTMELVGDSSEDPFENFINDVPDVVPLPNNRDRPETNARRNRHPRTARSPRRYPVVTTSRKRQRWTVLTSRKLHRRTTSTSRRRNSSFKVFLQR